MAQRSQGVGSLARTHADDGDDPQPRQDDEHRRQYRSEFVGDAKAVVVGMTPNGFTLADPNDRGMLDVVGFDTTAPAVIADFVRSL